MRTIDRPDLLDAEWESFDDRFGPCRGDRSLRRLYHGTRWAEGPVWVPAGRYLLWSDIPADRVLRWDELTGQVAVFLQPAGNANGHTLDRDGRVLSCEHRNRRVTRFEHDGSTTVIADRYQGKRLNSPNDVVVRSDRSIWFTDPTYGIQSHLEGDQSESEIGTNVYRVDATTGELTIAVDDFVQPNGLAFSVDERTLYVVDSDSSRGHMRAFSVADDGTLSGGDVFATCTNGIFDGFRLDDQGRIWTSAADGVHCYHPDGTLLGKLHIPEVVSNLAFGGARRNQLFITGTTSLYQIHVGARAPQLVG